MTYVAHLILITTLLCSASASISAQSISNEFADVEFCNHTNDNVALALLREVPEFGRDKWFLQNWIIVEAHGCKSYKKILQGYIYWYGVGNGKYWSGKERAICTSERSTFRRIFSDEECMAGEKLQGFSEALVPNGKLTINIR